MTFLALQQCEVEAQTFPTTSDLETKFRIGKYLNIHFGFDPKDPTGKMGVGIQHLTVLGLEGELNHLKGRCFKFKSYCF